MKCNNQFQKNKMKMMKINKKTNKKLTLKEINNKKLNKIKLLKKTHSNNFIKLFYIFFL